MPQTPAPAQPPSPPADVAADELEAVRAMFGADFVELASLFRRDAPGRIAALRASCAASDLAMLARVAHAFSGSAASMGAGRLSSLCRELELSCKAGDAARCTGTVDEIEGEYHRVSAKLAAMTKP